MPYVITTTAPEMSDHVPADGQPWPRTITRTAVATLDEARDHVASLGADYGAMAHLDCVLDGISRMPVGPLPDGTVIEVRQVTWDAIRADVGTDALAEYPSAQAAILVAFNAR